MRLRISPALFLTHDDHLEHNASVSVAPRAG
jgi:hypothetical protein